MTISFGPGLPLGFSLFGCLSPSESNRASAQETCGSSPRKFPTEARQLGNGWGAFPPVSPTRRMLQSHPSPMCKLFRVLPLCFLRFVHGVTHQETPRVSPSCATVCGYPSRAWSVVSLLPPANGTAFAASCGMPVLSMQNEVSRVARPPNDTPRASLEKGVPPTSSRFRRFLPLRPRPGGCPSVRLPNGTFLCRPVTRQSASSLFVTSSARLPPIRRRPWLQSTGFALSEPPQGRAITPARLRAG